MSIDSGMACAIGLMSGTSMDGVDVALLETDGGGRLSFGPTAFAPYDKEDRRTIRAAAAEAAEHGHRRLAGPIAAAADLVLERHVQAVEHFLASNGLDRRAVDIVGFHGQTILHRPRQRVTVQLGDGSALAHRLGVPVAFDFRRADVEAGGEGAPLVPVFHRALVEAAGLPTPVAVLNIGGVANVTIVPPTGDPIACDTGPGNALLDDWMRERAGAFADFGGAAAQRGAVDEIALAALLADPFFELPPPKSLDRNSFSFSFSVLRGASVEDGAATLTAFTAETAAAALRNWGGPLSAVVVCGGGARNPALVSELKRRVNCRVQTADELGWSADFVEAQAFAYLAVRTARALPLTFPTTTGAPRPLTGGSLARPS